MSNDTPDNSETLGGLLSSADGNKNSRMPPML
jgi:hypothetical protein